MGRIRGTGAGGEKDLQCSLRASDGETAPGQGCGGSAMCVRTPHPWGQGLVGFG